jgi:L-lactate utilization protein LutB
MVQQIDEKIAVAWRELEANNFNVVLADSSEVALRAVLDLIPQDAVVGIGDSATVKQIGLFEALESRGTKAIDPTGVRELTMSRSKQAEFKQELKRSLTGDIFVTGCNAVTLDGKLVNTDRAGNRVAGMIFGPDRVMLIAGRNKIVRDVDEALQRIKNLIAPAHAKQKLKKTPCIKTGKCTECDAPDRICNVTTIIEKKPLYTDITIVLVNEDLGLGWDPSWPEERVSPIRSRYEDVTWPFFTTD